MAKLDVLDWKKKKSGDVEVPEKMVNEEVRKDVLHGIVRWQLASRRQGTHDTKNRGDVRASSIKPYKQKGTGNARQGSRASMLLRGGSVAHGPHPRDYSFSMNKKVKQLGLRSALSYLYKEGRFFVVDEMSSKDGKTNELAKRLEGFGLSKALLIDESTNDMFARATKNLPKFRYNSVEGLNVYDLLKYDAVVLSRSSLDKVAQKCGVQ
ncbi:MAG: 50S ribosomal protein L4 [Bdellovibrionales bacterium]|nr:50S ribosomal protein L4 [Bdellovibrionales bacterium]NQZ17680.1 50S ribosomal protein L4 [Bdellovibrionales bacterium]